MEKIVLASFEFDTEAISRAKDENAKLKAEIIALRKEQAETNKVIKDSGQVTEQQAAQLSKNEAKLKRLNTAYQGNIKVINANASSTDAVNKLLTEQVKTEQQAISNIANLIQVRKGLNKDSETYKQQLDAINDKIDKNNNFLTEAGDAYTKQKRNIGNYTESIKGALNGQNLFNGSLNGFSSVTSALQPILTAIQVEVAGISSSFKAAAVSTEGMTVAQRASAVATAASSNALKILRVALISTGVGALVVALGSLVTFLSSTQRGIDAVTSVTRPLQAVFSSLLGVVQDLGGSLFDAFTNPQQALTDLSNFVQQNLINRFTAFGKILEGIVSFDFAKVTDGVLQAATGVEDVVGKVTAASEATSKFLQEAIDNGKLLDEIQKDIEQREADIVLSRAEATKLIKEQEVIAKDTSKTAEERNKAAQEALRISEEEIQKEKEILDLKIRQEEIQQSLNDSGRKDLTELNKLKAEQIALDERAAADQLKFVGVNRALQNERRQQIKEQQDAIKARKEAAIQSAKEELDFFKFTFDQKNATVDESLEFEQSVSDQRLEILDKEFEAGKLSKTAYELEKAKIAQEQLTATAQIVLDQASRELAIYDQTNKSRIDSNKMLTDEILRGEDERINLLLEKQKEFEAKRLELGVISQEQYNDRLAQLETDADAKKAEVEALKLEQEEEARAINLENLIAYRQLVGESEFELKREQLERERLAEIEAAEKVGADVALINKRYEVLQTQLNQNETNQRLDNTIDTLEGANQALQSIGTQSKELSSALALASTFQAINKTLADPKLTFPANVIQASIIGAQGLGNVARINAIRFADGGGVDGHAKGPSHRDGGMLFTVRNRPNYVGEFEGNEFIVNKKAAQKHRTLLERINADRYADGGIVPGNIGQSVTTAITTNTMSPEQVLTAIESRIARLEVVNLASETYKVATGEIRVRNEAIR